ncbi:Peptidase family M50 [uncultured archaeon]|nr:Peptidase family M50 [uncultured archaeon]
MDSSILFVGLFLAGTVVLSRMKFERVLGVVFLLRTRWGIKLIDSIAKLSPGFWKFMADAGLFLSFGGLGAAYLHRTKEGYRHLQILVPAVGVLSAVFAYLTGYVELAVAALVLSALGVVFRKRMDAVFAVTVGYFTVAYHAFFMLLFSPPSTISVLIASFTGVFGMPVLLFAGLFFGAYQIMFKASTMPGVSPLLPATKGGNLGVTFPGYDIFIPWWYALIALLTTLVSHEIAHGIVAKAHGVRIKSTGLLTLGALPIGAFVEPDEEALKKGSHLTAARVYVAGSFSNLLVSFAALGLIAALVLFSFVGLKSDGVLIFSTFAGSPASSVVSSGSVLYSLNNYSILNVEDFVSAASTVKPGDKVVLNTSAGVAQFNAAANPDNSSKGFLGVMVIVNTAAGSRAPQLYSAIGFATTALEWIWFFTLNIALVNLLPVVPFDGGFIFPNLLTALKLKPGQLKKITYWLIALTALTFIINALPLIKSLGDAVLSFAGLN